MNIMKKSTIAKKSTLATLAAALTISACDPDASDELELDEDERVVVSLNEKAIEILSWVGGEAASFVAAEAFGIALPEEAANLSEEALAEIRNIIADEIREAAIIERNGLFKGVVTKFNSYNRAPCDTLAESGDCSINELDNRAREAKDVLGEVVDHYNVYVSWATQGNTLDDLLTDEDWRVYLSPNVRMAITMDLALRREVFEIDYLKGLEVAKQSWVDLRDNAANHIQVLNGIENKYNEIIGKFGDSSYRYNLGDHGNGRYVACYDAPEGRWCTDRLDMVVEQNCTDSIAGSYCSLSDSELDEAMKPLQTAADEHRTTRLANFTALAVGDQAGFDTMQGHIQAIVDQEGLRDCEPGRRAIEAGPLASDAAAQEACLGVCETARGTFTGQWWTTVPGEMSVCQCDITC